ncbi:hypothetical protein CLOSTASPAR_04023 [[Clostridium] asparagiforme DSM 15981]|uniref:Uncharacterized protein n=1 Tax=[Clostridium] asparagiforme DSM 15981 TaxID=518636 RepID=C0D432_9FIRM|nr:hypothetical protein CLOSTASPAR_04023 [[Clostridium] asparagiforme DSM 15981]
MIISSKHRIAVDMDILLFAYRRRVMAAMYVRMKLADRWQAADRLC